MRRIVLTALLLVSMFVVVSPVDAKPPAEPPAPQIDLDTLASVVFLYDDNGAIGGGIVTRGGAIVTTYQVAMVALRHGVRAGEARRKVSVIEIDAKRGFAILQMHGLIPPMSKIDRHRTPLRKDDFVVCTVPGGDDTAKEVIPLRLVRKYYAAEFVRGQDAKAYAAAEDKGGVCGVFDAKTRALKALYTTRRDRDGFLSRMTPVETLRELLKEAK